MFKKLIQGGVLAAALLVGVFASVQSVSAEQNGVIINIPVSTIVRGEAGSEHLLATKTLPDDQQGLTCNVSTKAENQGSVHPNSDLIVQSGNSQVVLEDVERAPGVTTVADDELLIGETISVTLRLGRDKVFSGGIEVKVSCAPAPKCPIEGKTHLPKNDPNCKENEEKCEIAGKEHLPKDDPECKEEPQVLPAATLPVTGPGFAIVALPITAAVAGYAFMVKRQKA